MVVYTDYDKKSYSCRLFEFNSAGQIGNNSLEAILLLPKQDFKCF